MLYGAAFRAFRKSRGFTLKELTSEISISSLSRFEMGKQDIGIIHLSEVLTNMNASLSDWLVFANQATGDSDSFNSELMRLYTDANVGELKQLFDNVSQKYKLDKDTFSFEKMMITANVYHDLTGKDLLNSHLRDLLYDKMFALTDWDLHALRFFGDTTTLLPPEQLLTLEKEVIKQLPSLFDRSYTAFLECWTAVLNGYEALIDKQLELALQIQPLIMQQSGTVGFSSFQIRRYFLNELLSYQATNDKDTQSVHFSKLVQTISFLDEIGSKRTAAQYMTAFHQAQKKMENVHLH